jgi:hypothetical protein
MSIKLSSAKILTATEAVALTTHRTSLGVDHVNLATRVRVTGLTINVLNNEQSTAIGGSASNEFVPLFAIAHMEAVGGAGATGDTQITIGTSAGGTQILGATALTGLDGLNDHFLIALGAGLTTTLTTDSTIYCKVTTKDTSAGAGHLVDVYIVGYVFVSGT